MPQGFTTRICLAAGLLALVLLIAAEPPPAITMPAGQPRNYTVLGQALLIRPGVRSTYLRFDHGVEVTGTDFKMHADTVELDIASSEVTSGAAFKLPHIEGAEERVVEDPGQTAAEMARQMQLPAASFSASAIKRVGALGSVRVVAKGMSLATAGLVSTDGGRSWATTGRCTIKRVDPGSGDTYELAADDVFYDSKTQRAIAKGKVSGLFKLNRREAVEVEAESCTLDLQKGTLASDGLLTARQGPLSLTCGTLKADLKAQTVNAGGSPHLEESGYGITLDASSIKLDLASQVVTAQDRVVVHETKRNIRLTAGELVAGIRDREYTATKDPVVTYGGSTFTGKKIVVRQDGKKTIVEVAGEQEARIDLDEAESLAKPAP